MPHRQQRIDRLAALIARRSSPRAWMLAVVSAAGISGFLTSALLLWSGLRYMPVRYGIACMVGYGAFLWMMNRWLHRTAQESARQSLVETAVDTIDIPGAIFRGRSGGSSPAADVLLGGGRSGGAGASAAFESNVAMAVPPPVPASKGLSLDVDLDGDAAKVLLPLMAVAALVIGLAAAISVVWQAPQLLAEVMVDAALAGAAYGRLRAAKTDWTFGVIRKTWLPALVITVTCVLLGWAGHALQPDADSIGDFFR